MQVTDRINNWISTFASKIHAGRGKAIDRPYNIVEGSDYEIDFPQGFILNYGGPTHGAYKRAFSAFPLYIRINKCTNFFNVKGGAYLEKVSGFPKHIEAADKFLFEVTSFDSNLDYLVKCFTLARKWVMTDNVPVEFKFNIGSIIEGKSHYFTKIVDINNSNVDEIDEKWFITKCIIKPLLDISNDRKNGILNYSPKLIKKMESSVNLYFRNKHSDTKEDYGRRNNSRVKELNKEFAPAKKSNKYFPIIDVLTEVQKANNGSIDLRTEVTKAKTYKSFRFYATKLYASSPAYKVFSVGNMLDSPNKLADFLADPEFQVEIKEDEKGKKLVFNLDRDSRKEVTKKATLKEQKKWLDDLGIYYSWDENTIRGNKDLSNVWVIQMYNKDTGKLEKPLFIEVRNGNGKELISEYGTQLKYFYYCMVGRTLDNYLNSRVRTYSTYYYHPDEPMQDDRNYNVGDITPLVGKK